MLQAFSTGGVRNQLLINEGALPPRISPQSCGSMVLCSLACKEYHPYSKTSKLIKNIKQKLYNFVNNGLEKTSLLLQYSVKESSKMTVINKKLILDKMNIQHCCGLDQLHAQVHYLLCVRSIFFSQFTHYSLSESYKSSVFRKGEG